MRLFEAILQANHRALAGDNEAGLRPADYADELPVVALTCIDPRLNPILPEALGLPEDQFIWLRNAGNIITSPISSTMRSLSLACAVKGGKEIVVIGHTDCLVAKHTALSILENLQKMGVRRESLPDNIHEFFGMFGNERANIVKAVALIRSSPLIGPGIPVQGLLVDTETGSLEWVVNGYETLTQNALRIGEQFGGEIGEKLGHTVDMLKNLSEFNLGEIKFPDIKIGDLASKIEDLANRLPGQGETPPAPAAGTPPPAPPKLPLPSPNKPKLSFKRSRR